MHMQFPGPNEYVFILFFFVENPAGSSFLLSRVYLVRFVLLILVYITYKPFWGLQTELCGLSSLHNNVQLAQPLYDSSLNSLIKRMLLQLCASICLKFLHECLEVLFPRGATQMAITHGIIIKKKFTSQRLVSCGSPARKLPSVSDLFTLTCVKPTRPVYPRVTAVSCGCVHLYLYCT